MKLVFEDAYIRSVEHIENEYDGRRVQYQEMKVAQGDSDITLRSYEDGPDLLSIFKGTRVASFEAIGDFSKPSQYRIQFTPTSIIGMPAKAAAK